MEECNILHCDANNFYASVEIAKNPELQGKNLAVCGDPERRHGIVLAKSNGAKALGVKTGDTVWQAKQKCPDLIVLKPDFASYSKYSNALFDIYTSYTDCVESFGLDECWLDVRASHRLFGSSMDIAESIRNRVKTELGITVSIGVSFTKIFAKLGSDYKKPDAITHIDKENYKRIVWGLPVEDLLMVGRSTQKFFHTVGITTIGQLANYNPRILAERLGVNGTALHRAANGLDEGTVRKYYEKRIPESIGNGCTTTRDLTTTEECEAVITALAETVAARLRKHGMRACGVHLTVKYNNLQCEGKQMKSVAPIASCTDITSLAMKLLPVITAGSNLPIRALTVTAIYLIGADDYNQPTCLGETEIAQKHTRLEESVDAIRNKYGFGALKRGNQMLDLFEADNLPDAKEAEELKPFKK